MYFFPYFLGLSKFSLERDQKNAYNKTGSESVSQIST